MPTGFTNKLGEAYVDLFVKDRRYLQGLAQAEAALNAFIKRANAQTVQLGVNLGRGGGRGGAGGGGGSFVGLSALQMSGIKLQQQQEKAYEKFEAKMKADAAKLANQKQALNDRLVMKDYRDRVAYERRLQQQAERDKRAAQQRLHQRQMTLQRQQAADAEKLEKDRSARVAAIKRFIGRQVGNVGNAIGFQVGMVGREFMEMGGMRGALQPARWMKDAVEQEKTVARLSRALGTGQESAERMSKSLFKIGTEVAGIKNAEVFEAANFGARLGIPEKELERFTKDIAMIGSVLEDIPIEDAATRMARLATVFKRPTDEILRMGSALNALDLASSASAKDILDITTRMSPGASLLGMTVQQTMAIATALKEAGVPNESAGTSMNQLWQRMASKKDSGNFAKIAGMREADFRKLLFSDAFSATNKVVSGMAAMKPEEQMRALETVHLDGQRVRGTFLSLARVQEQLNEHTKTGNAEYKSMQSILKGNANVAGTAAGQFARLSNMIDRSTKTIGTALLPIVKGSIDAFQDLFTDIGAYLEDNKAAIEGWAKSIGAKIREVGTLFQNWENIKTVVKETFIGIGDVVLDVFEQIGDRLGKIFHNVGQGIAATFAGIFDTIADNVNAILPPWLGKMGKIGFKPDMQKVDPINLNMGLIDNRPGLVMARMQMQAKRAFMDAKAALQNAMGMKANVEGRGPFAARDLRPQMMGPDIGELRAAEGKRFARLNRRRMLRQKRAAARLRRIFKGKAPGVMRGASDFKEIQAKTAALRSAYRTNEGFKALWGGKAPRDPRGGAQGMPEEDEVPVLLGKGPDTINGLLAKIEKKVGPMVWG